VEEALLKELEAMGFKQVDLNKEVLRMTDYNLEQSIDELCGVLDWDPLLEELHEMVSCFLDGFFNWFILLTGKIISLSKSKGLNPL